MKLSQSDIDQAKSVRLSAIVSKHTALKRAGSDLVGLCPFHSEKSPSFYVHDDEGYFHCFGCAASGDVIDFVQRIEGCSFLDAIERMGVALTREPSLTKPPSNDALAGSRKDLAARREAELLWKQSAPCRLVDAACRYFSSRGITNTSRQLGYHPAAGAIIAAVRNECHVLTAVQRIYLNSDGTNVKIDGHSLRRTRGPMGDGAVRLSEPDAVLGIAESVEKAMAVEQLFSLPCWASLGAHRMAKLAIPPQARRIIIFADNDQTGIAQAAKGVEFYRSKGRMASMELPWDGHKDWDDITRGMKCQDHFSVSGESTDGASTPSGPMTQQ